MRALTILWLFAWLIVGLGAARAQYPYGYPGYGYPNAYPGYGYPNAYPGHGYPGYGYPGYPPPGAPYRPAVPSPPTDGSLSAAMLAAHNAVRSRLSLPPLAWSAQLAAVAQEWANALIASHRFGHRPANRYGENLYSISGGAASPSQVVAAWAGEARSYDIRSNSCSGMCGHYTQIVWRATRSVGCAVATDVEREVWVCNYDPPGNVVGYRPY